MIALEFRVLTDEEANALENTAHNPPVFSDSFSEDDFEQEWWAVCDRLASRLKLFGEPWTVENEKGDFMLPETSGRDRWIYVNFCSTRLWRPEFVAAVADLLRDTAHDYRVACLTELNDISDP